MTVPSLWQDLEPGTAFPALTGDDHADVVVIGAGVTGCACARTLASAGRRVMVVDGREVAAAASGRNGGFASTGPALGFARLVLRVGAETAHELQRLTAAAMDQMIALAPRHVRRTGSLWLATDEEAGDLLATLSALRDAGGGARLAPELIPPRMARWYPLAAVLDADGEILPAGWVRTLAGAAAAAGALIREHSPVVSIAPDGGGMRVEVEGGASVTAPDVVVACDGLTADLVPELAGIVYPVRGQVLATAPLERPPVALPTHSDHGFYYYRPAPGGRLTLGGGRHHDLEAEYTSHESTSEPIQAVLDAFLEQRLGVPAQLVTQRWAGIMGFSADLLPLVGAVPGRPGLWVCGGYSGVGNVPGFALGQALAATMLGDPPGAALRALDPARFVRNGRIVPPAERQEQAESRAVSAGA